MHESGEQGRTQPATNWRMGRLTCPLQFGAWFGWTVEINVTLCFFEGHQVALPSDSQSRCHCLFPERLRVQLSLGKGLGGHSPHCLPLWLIHRFKDLHRLPHPWAFYTLPLHHFCGYLVLGPLAPVGTRIANRRARKSQVSFQASPCPQLA